MSSSTRRRDLNNRASRATVAAMTSSTHDQALARPAGRCGAARAAVSLLGLASRATTHSTCIQPLLICVLLDAPGGVEDRRLRTLVPNPLKLLRARVLQLPCDLFINCCTATQQKRSCRRERSLHMAHRRLKFGPRSVRGWDKRIHAPNNVAICQDVFGKRDTGIQLQLLKAFACVGQVDSSRSLIFKELAQMFLIRQLLSQFLHLQRRSLRNQIAAEQPFDDLAVHAAAVLASRLGQSLPEAGRQPHDELVRLVRGIDRFWTSHPPIVVATCHSQNQWRLAIIAVATSMATCHNHLMATRHRKDRSEARR